MIFINENGSEVLIDDEDEARVLEYKWWTNSRGYIYSYRKGVFATAFFLHRFILGVERRYKVDHINHNILDNRKANLRICSSQQNACNRVKKRTSVSMYKGVSWNKRTGKWTATICVDRVNYHLLTSSSELDCAYAYNIAAQIIHKQFALPNLIEFTSFSVKQKVIFRLRKHYLISQIDVTTHLA